MNYIKNLINAFEKFKSLNAISYKNDRLTYGQLLNLANKISNQLQSLSIYESPIGILCERGFEPYISILGTLFSGNFYIPINLDDSFEKNKNIIISSNLKIIFGSEKSICRFKEKFQIEKIKINFFEVSISSHSTYENKILFTENDSLMYILYTSGSTGIPKGVRISKSNIFAFTKGINNIWKLEPKYKFSQFFELSFDPSMADIFVCFINGGELCVVPKEELFFPIDFIVREEIDVWASVPSIGSIMIKSGKLKDNLFHNLKILCFCGEPFPKNVADILSKCAPKAEIWNCYGPTEATIYVTAFKYKLNKNSYHNGNLPIGHPLKETQVEIIDSNNNKLQNGIKGEIVYKGPQISLGYLNDKQKTYDSFVKFEWDQSDEVWYKSGDIGILNNNGQIECLGRLDSQIKLSGKRIEISEIEFFFKNYTLFNDIVIIPVKDFNLRVSKLIGFTLVAYELIEIAKIRQLASKHINEVFFPQKIITIEKFPFNANGKLDRSYLLEKYYYLND